MNGSRLKEIRETLELQQDEIALHIGVNNETVCRWERQNSEIRKAYADTIERLAIDPDAVKELKADRVTRKMNRRTARLRRAGR